jgi:pimeloyl-ACP methyl ester carboxylesterase
MQFPQKVAAGIRTAARMVRRGALGRIARVIPRTAVFATSKGQITPGVQVPTMTKGLAAGFALDEVVMASFLTPRRFPDDAEAERVSEELLRAHDLYQDNGWIENPLGYHRTPPLLTNRDLAVSTRWTRGFPYRHLSWESGYEPYDGEPGVGRWLGYEANKRAAADIVGDPARMDRPWLVCVHGYTMGYANMDFQGLQAKRLHNELGFNLALPVLPLHGPRKATRISGEDFLSFDLMNSIHGFAQAIWDIRRLVSWIRQQGARQIGLYGVSLGGYTVALLAGIEDGLDTVVSGVPVSDVRLIMVGHSPPHVKEMADKYGLASIEAHRVVSPLAFAPKIPRDKRFIFAGYGDRISSPAQAQNLWHHWEEPEVCWYPSGHLGYMWSGEVAAFLGQSLRRALLAPEEASTEEEAISTRMTA